MDWQWPKDAGTFPGNSKDPPVYLMRLKSGACTWYGPPVEPVSETSRTCVHCWDGARMTGPLREVSQVRLVHPR